jgi:probable rRNA maturation factor
MSTSPRAVSRAPRRTSPKTVRRQAARVSRAHAAQSDGPAGTANKSCSVSISNRQRALRVDRRRLTRLVKSVLALEQVARAEISIAIVGDQEIHDVNRRYLGHDYPTDVISFLLDSAKIANGRGIAGRAVRRGAGKSIDGEIVISAETARRWSIDYGNSPGAELELYLVHGLLHLCGYDDLTPREKRLMRRREAESLAAFSSES